MDQQLDFRIYLRLTLTMPSVDNILCQKKVLLTRIFKFSPEKRKYLYGEIGGISLQSGQLQKSLRQLKAAIKMDPDTSYVQVLLAKALLKLEKENEALLWIQKALCLDPSYSEAHNTVIEIFMKRERLEGVDSFYQEVVNMLPDPRLIVHLYIGSAQALVASDTYPKALEMYKKVFETDRMNSGYHFEYGMALYHEGLFEEAIVQFEHVKRLDPTDKIAFNNTAHLQYCLGKLQKAFEEFEHIIESGLESTATYSNFILVLYHMDKDEEVINRYRDIFQQNLGGNRFTLQSLYEEASKITQAILERDDIDEETREFNTKKRKGLTLVLSFIN